MDCYLSQAQWSPYVYIYSWWMLIKLIFQSTCIWIFGMMIFFLILYFRYFLLVSFNFIRLFRYSLDNISSIEQYRKYFPKFNFFCMNPYDIHSQSKLNSQTIFICITISLGWKIFKNTLCIKIFIIPHILFHFNSSHYWVPNQLNRFQLVLLLSVCLLSLKLIPLNILTEM